jgi:Na+-driven multidrug efflux pump
VGAHIIGIRIEAVSYLPGAAMGIAAATLAGQYLGANDPQTARKAVGYCWAFGATLMCICGTLFMTIPDLLIGLVTDQPEFLATSPCLLFHAGWSQLGFATYLVLSYAIRGAGDTRSALAMSFTSTYLVRLPLVYLLAVVFEAGLVGVWIACSVELVLRGALFLARFLHGGWTRVNV